MAAFGPREGSLADTVSATATITATATTGTVTTGMVSVSAVAVAEIVSRREIRTRAGTVGHGTHRNCRRAFSYRLHPCDESSDASSLSTSSPGPSPRFASTASRIRSRSCAGENGLRRTDTDAIAL